MTFQEELKADQDRLAELLTEMRVPSMRREFSHWNLMWLSRNLFIRNGGSEHCNEAIGLVKKLLREFFE